MREFLHEQNLYGGEHAALTESEGRGLLHAGSLDTAGNRIAAAKHEGIGSALPGVLRQAHPAPETQAQLDPSSGADFSNEQFSLAWHGSPNTFDKFSTEHMGSGEGSQAFGWGMYFAGRKAVGEYYRDMFARRLARDAHDVEMERDGVKLDHIQTLAEYFKPGRVVSGYGGDGDLCERVASHRFRYVVSAKRRRQNDETTTPESDAPQKLVKKRDTSDWHLTTGL